MSGEEQPQFDRNWAKLNKLTSRHVERKFVNLLLIQMLRGQISHVELAEHQRATRVLGLGGDSPMGTQKHDDYSCDFVKIWRRLTIMAVPPQPWWHHLPFWHTLPFYRQQWIDQLFWKPPLAMQGRFEIFNDDGSMWVSFRSIEPGRLQIDLSKPEPIRKEGRPYQPCHN